MTVLERIGGAKPAAPCRANDGVGAAKGRSLAADDVLAPGPLGPGRCAAGAKLPPPGLTPPTLASPCGSFMFDVMTLEAPQHACGSARGKAEEQAKCGGIALFGCATGNAVACFIAGGASLLCMYAVEKACEQEPDTCQPGWTEG